MPSAWITAGWFRSLRASGGGRLCAALLDSNGLQDLFRGEKRVKRGEKRSSIADDREVANSTRTTPGSVRVVTGMPLSRNTDLTEPY
jgi:hypothetical protein